MEDTTVALAAIGLAGSITAGFFAFMSKLIKSLDSVTASNREASKAAKEVAKATKQAAKEAKDRNGHLAKLVVDTARHTQEIIGKPVSVQTVETQVIKEVK